METDGQVHPIEYGRADVIALSKVHTAPVNSIQFNSIQSEQKPFIITTAAATDVSKSVIELFCEGSIDCARHS